MYYREYAEACALGMPDKNYWKYFKKYGELPPAKAGGFLL